MKEHLIKLENGLRVCLIPNKNVDSVVVYLKGLAGSNYESQNNVGVAHILEHMVLENSALLSQIINNGGKYIGVTSRDDVLFGLHTMKSSLELNIEFLSQIFYKSQFDEELLQKVKCTIKAEINRYNDIPEKLIGRLAYKTIFPNSRLAKLNTGNANDVEKISIRDLRDFHKKFYVNGRFVLVITGNFEAYIVEKLIKNSFNRDTQNDAQESIAEIAKEFNFVQHVLNFEQAYIRIDFTGVKTSDDKKYDTTVLAKTLDTLVKNEIRKKGIAYKTGVSSFTAHEYGMFSFFGTCENSKLDSLIDVFLNSKKYISAEIVESSKKAVISNLIFSLEKPSMVAEYYSDLLLHGHAKQNRKYEIEQLSKVTIENVLEIANQIFSDKPKITLISNKNRDFKLTESGITY